MSHEECYYFTFGIGHILKNKAIKIYGDYETARAIMVESFGTKWCGQYNEAEYTDLASRYRYEVVAEVKRK